MFRGPGGPLRQELFTVREAAIFFSDPATKGGGGGKGLATKKYLFLKLEKKIIKKCDHWHNDRPWLKHIIRPQTNRLTCKYTTNDRITDKPIKQLNLDILIIIGRTGFVDPG